jgi:N4-gp56 family major capsid protein
MKYDIQTPTSTTVGGWVEVNRYNNAEKIFNGEIGSLYGFKVVSTTNAKLRYGLSATATASGAEAYALAPRAYYVTELSEMSARTYVKQLGSAGAADPTNDLATVGAKVFFTAIPGGNKFTGSTSATEYRLLHVLGRTATAVTF